MQVYILIADDTVKLVNNILCTFVVWDKKKKTKLLMVHFVAFVDGNIW